MGLVITMSGPPGSGKSHCAERIAEIYGLPYHSSGGIFREMARERGLSLEEFSRLAGEDPSIDREVDRRTSEAAKGGGAVLEGRLVPWFTDPRGRLSFYLTAPFRERAKRISEREGISLAEAEEKTRGREEGERERYLRLYGIDLRDLSVYDFIINTAIWDKDAIVALLKAIIDTYLRTRPAPML